MRKPEEIATAFAPRDRLDEAERFFLVGIGGAGMSPLARMLHRRGHTVLGTDGGSDEEVARLREAGIDAQLGHSGDKIQPGDAVIFSDAIDLATSPEAKRAKDLGLGIFRRSQALGWLLKGKRVLAVTGTHGKTTTTGMAGAALAAAGLDPLVVVGAAIPEWGGPVREGQGDWAVVEACEAYDSFHDLDPEMVLLTNLELDHVDFHGDWQSLKASVVRFVQTLPPEGKLVYCKHDPGACEVAQEAGKLAVPYEAVDAVLRLPGEHNRVNAGGALAAAVAVGADPEAALHGIAGYGGAERRLQVLLDDDLAAIDDYAHHPTEIEASIGALRERYPGRRIVAAFQPHLYSRTADLIPEFAAALDLADQVLLTDIYPAREAPMPGVSSARIAEAMRRPVRYVPSRHLLPRIAASLAKPGDVVVGMGAGTIHEFAPEFVREWSRKRQVIRPKRVAVVLGGDTSEREVSLHSGRAVLDALRNIGFDAIAVDVSELLLKGRALDAFVGADRPDVVFLAIHGTPMEGGAAQGLFELLHLPYTGSGMLASALAMDKSAAKVRLRTAGIPVPNGWIVRRGDPLPEDAGTPLVVKPNREGSTVGLTFVDDLAQLPDAVRRALDYDESALIEERILGMEISVPVLGDRALPVVEIVPATGRYDFARKYLPGATEEIIPARLPEPVARLAQERALAAHRALGCAGATRTDFIVRDGTDPIALEVNTLPGLTKTSLLPNSAKAAGIEFEELVRWIVEDALAREEV